VNQSFRFIVLELFRGAAPHKFHYDVPLLLVFSEGPSLDVNDGVRTVEDIDTAVRGLEHADRARDAREDPSDPRADAVPSSREL
jgi:hypothetical protein